MDNERIRQVNEATPNASSGPIVYWMSRDQRVRDNWALLYAQKEAIAKKAPLVVLFCFVPRFLKGTLRQYGFMLRGLSQVEADLKKKNIPFFLLTGEPGEEIPAFLEKHQASGLFTDFSPLRTKKRWLWDVVQAVSVPVFEVDAHNIVPCWKPFKKQSESAEAFRVKLRSILPVFLDTFPIVRKHPFVFSGKVAPIHWGHILKATPFDRSVKEVSWAIPGEREAQKAVRGFLKQKIKEYRSGKTSRSLRGQWQWRLQPYLHFGQLSIQKVVWSVMHSEIESRFKAAFLESLITRREFADHFCYHNDLYDSVRGFPQWAQETLRKHCHDAREHLYSMPELESAATHDALWNALQKELVSHGIIFGWARRYWAKKILEWTQDPQEALFIAISLTEKYSLNGWEPNSYFNIAKAIGGVCDDPSLVESPVFGQVSYMKENHREARADLRTYAGKI